MIFSLANILKHCTFRLTYRAKLIRYHDSERELEMKDLHDREYEKLLRSMEHLKSVLVRCNHWHFQGISSQILHRSLWFQALKNHKGTLMCTDFNFVEAKEDPQWMNEFPNLTSVIRDGVSMMWSLLTYTLLTRIGNWSVTGTRLHISGKQAYAPRYLNVLETSLSMNNSCYGYSSHSCWIEKLSSLHYDTFLARAPFLLEYTMCNCAGSDRLALFTQSMCLVMSNLQRFSYTGALAWELALTSLHQAGAAACLQEFVYKEDEEAVAEATWFQTPETSVHTILPNFVALQAFHVEKPSKRADRHTYLHPILGALQSLQNLQVLVLPCGVLNAEGEVAADEMALLKDILPRFIKSLKMHTGQEVEVAEILRQSAVPLHIRVSRLDGNKLSALTYQPHSISQLSIGRAVGPKHIARFLFDTPLPNLTKLDCKSLQWDKHEHSINITELHPDMPALVCAIITSSLGARIYTMDIQSKHPCEHDEAQVAADILTLCEDVDTLSINIYNITLPLLKVLRSYNSLKLKTLELSFRAFKKDKLVAKKGIVVGWLKRIVRDHSYLLEFNLMCWDLALTAAAFDDCKRSRLKISVN